jgi:uncharacterized membrane protein YfhO
MADAGYLVLADTHYPGWNATIDGLASEILPANHAFRAVQLSEGQHAVVFEYAPVSFRLGLWLTIGAMAAWLVVISGCWALGRGR